MFSMEYNKENFEAFSFHSDMSEETSMVNECSQEVGLELNREFSEPNIVEKDISPLLFERMDLQLLQVGKKNKSTKNKVSKGGHIAGREDYSLLSMFTGIGGLDMGFEGGFEYKSKKYKAHPYKTIAAFEKDEKCVETIRKNLGIPVHQVELSEKIVTTLPAAEVLIGGFPCQEFSSCGPKRGLNSERGQLYKVLVEYMAQKKPLVVCAENVPNLARMQSGAVLETITKDFAAQGYKVQVWNLYAPDYGVPQNRRRLFFVCTREDLPGEPKLPIPEYLGKPLTTKWAISDLENITDETVPNQSQYFKASRAKRGNGQGDERCKAYEPSYTIRANAKSRVQFHYSLDRRLTVRECARLQTFPDTYVFPHSATSSVMQIGNAVPPVLAHVVASSITEFLETL